MPLAIDQRRGAGRFAVAHRPPGYAACRSVPWSTLTARQSPNCLIRAGGCLILAHWEFELLLMPTISKDEIIAKLTDPGIIAVIRARSAEQVPAVCDALLAGGVIAL